MNGQRKILLFGLLCAGLAVAQSAFLLAWGLFYHHTIHILIGWGIGLTGAISALSFHIASLHCSSFISVTTILIKYTIHWFMAVFRMFHVRSFRKATRDCTKAQADFLLKRIRQNEGTAYGTDHHFKDIQTVQDFIRKHPLTSYEHYAPYIKRVANGELGIMAPERPVILGKTSGTTGVAKMLPVGKECMASFMGNTRSLQHYQMCTVNGMPSPGPLQMGCSVQIGAFTDVTEGGIPVGPITSFLFTEQIRQLLFTTPVVASDIMHEPTSMYVHALFALRDENLGSIWAPFASSLYLFFRFLEMSWHLLVQDIRQGTISESLQALSKTEREALKKYCVPLPERANEVERQFRRGFDDIVTRLWPNMPIVYTVTSGSMQTFTRRLRKYTGKLPVLSGLYVSTEGIMGIACDFPYDGQTKYVCLPSGMFYEFIPADYCDEKNPGTLLLEEVRKDECYELVITNMDGLYRYRIGDVVKIMGFFDKAPIFEFQYRNGELLNIRAEKTSEVSVTSALQETLEKWEGAQLVHYVCADSPLYEEAAGKESDASLMYYVVFLEVTTPEDSELLTHTEQRQKFEEEFDANMRTFAVPYDKCRAKQTLGAPRVVFLDSLAFSAFRVHLLETSDASASQLKLPRKLRKLEWVSLFLQHELKCTSTPYDV